MKRLVPIFFLFFCLLLYQLGFAKNPEHRKQKDSGKLREAIYLLETWIQSVIDFDRIPGISIAVVHDQKIIYAKGFGYADIKKKIKATPNTIYRIASISKLFTAIAEMQLQELGKLSIEDPVSKYLPWFTPKLMSSEPQTLTLKDLLRHSSGLPHEPDHTVWSDPDLLFPSREELIDRVSNLRMSYITNTNFNYSNLGYSLLGEVVSIVSGMKYEDYITENILEPLGLEATTPYLPKESMKSKMAIGYGRWPRKGTREEVTNYDWRAITPAGGFASTVKDIAEFAKWQFRVLDGKDDFILSQETLKEMQTIQWSNPQWGFGFSIWQIEDKCFVGHQGGCPGYKSQIILCPEEKIAVVAMINASDAPQFTLVYQTYKIMARALKPSNCNKTMPHQWEKYIGYYTADNSWSEAEVLEWDGSLAVMWIPSANENPLGSLIRLKNIKGNVFRQLRANGSLGKHYVFKDDHKDQMVTMKFNNNLLKKTAN